MEALFAWMNEHQQLSGWAQTFGAMLALLVALIVPWRQHAIQTRRAELAMLESNIYLSIATMLLIRDAQNLNERIRALAHMPKQEINDPVVVQDLLERARTLDAKDNSVPRQASQYIARAAVLRINHYLDSLQAETREITPPVLEMLKSDFVHLENEHSKLNMLLQDFLYQQTRLQVSRWKRPFVWYGFKTQSGRKWLEAESTKQVQQLQKKYGYKDQG